MNHETLKRGGWVGNVRTAAVGGKSSRRGAASKVAAPKLDAPAGKN
jgi:hypothetical protein